VLRGGGPDATAMWEAGFALARRVLAFPFPVVTAASGHAIAMGLFLLESGDYVVGASGRFRFAANEVAIGLEVPPVGLDVLRQRLLPAVFNRMVMLALPVMADHAVAAGLLDELVAPDALLDTAQSLAASLTSLDMTAHHGTKLAARSILPKEHATS
jgi:enoyl-CoA hydratase